MKTYYVYMLACQKKGLFCVEAAIEKEKQMKKWQRAWKIRLIEESNPERHDLSEGWGALCE